METIDVSKLIYALYTHIYQNSDVHRFFRQIDEDYNHNMPTQRAASSQTTTVINRYKLYTYIYHLRRQVPIMSGIAESGSVLITA
jgi:hypothetical protein